MIKVTSRHRPLIAAVLVFIITAVAAAALIWRLEEYRLQGARSRVSDVAIDHATSLKLHIERAFSATYALAALVRQGNGTVREFKTVAAQTRPFYPGVAALELAPGGVIKYIEPLAGNEGAIGHDLLKDPGRNKEALLARNTGQLTLAGPFDLVQGGLGAVARLPVFLNDAKGRKNFWGFTAVLVRFPEMLAPAKLSQLFEQGFAYELWRIQPDTNKKQVIAASSTLPLFEPVQQSLELPNGTWTLSVAPANGWGNPRGLALKVALGLLFSLILAFLAKLLVESKAHEAKLEALVAERTAEYRESEERLRLLSDNLPNSYIYQYLHEDPKQPQFLHLSAGVEKIHGVSRQEVLEDANILLRQIDPEQLPAMEAMEAAGKRNMTDFQMELRMLRPDGEWRWLNMRSHPRRKESGQVLCDGVATDVTAEKIAEAALETARVVAVQEKSYLEVVMEVLPVGVAIRDTNGKYIRVNAMFKEVWAGPDALVANFTESVKAWFIEGGQPVQPEEWASVHALRNDQKIVGQLLKIERFDGSHTYIHNSAAPFHDSEGKVAGCAVAVMDISEQIQTRESLRSAKEAAEAANLAKSQFLANMSHELRTPMTSILGMIQLALEEDLAPATKDYLETTLDSARSLLRILNDILDMTNIVAGRLSIEKKPFLLRKCVSEAIDMIAPEARRKGLDIALSMSDKVPDNVAGDQVRLRQVLLNLISNSVKFTTQGKVEVRIATGGTTPENSREITFAVTDTGIGIPENKKDLLFQAFSQADTSHSRSFGGVGLGLFISREIVELLGGTICFDSQEGVGSTFTFTIPMAEGLSQGESISPAEDETANIAAPATEVQRTPQLLLAEDDPTIRQLFGQMIKKYNYNLDVAEDGLEAVEMWEKGDYDLVLMDIQMPRLDGFEATHAIREKERERGGHTAIVAVTAHALKEDVNKCLAAGMDAYVSKPIEFKKTFEIISEIIRERYAAL